MEEFLESYLILTLFFEREEKASDLFFPDIGDVNEDHILFLTEISLEDRCGFFIIGAKKLILHEIFLVFCHLYRQ